MAIVKHWQAVFSRVRATLMSRGCTSDDADDLVQEAWLRLARYQLDHHVDRPEAFLMRTALNLSIDAFRVQRNHGEQVLLDEMTESDLARVGTAATAEEIVQILERLARIGDCLATVDERTRAIYLDHLVEGMTYQEIAKAHGLSLRSVERRLAKAMLAVMRGLEAP